GNTARRLVQGDVERQSVERLQHLLARHGKVVADLGMLVQRTSQRDRRILQPTGLVTKFLAGTVPFD
ncbi:MAG: hypothetical protein ACK55I_10230, partial [bacterium]